MSRIRGTFVAMIALAMGLCVSAEGDFDKSIPKLVLKDGRILENVTIVVFGPQTVMAKWDGGRGSIHYDELPAQLEEKALAVGHPATAGTPFSMPSGPTSPEAEALEKRIFDAEGGEAMLAMKALRKYGEVGRPGEGAPLIVTSAPPNFDRRELLGISGRILTGRGPEGSWSAVQKAGGLLERSRIKPQVTITRADEFFDPLWRWRELGGHLEILAEEMVVVDKNPAQQRAAVLSLSLPDGMRLDYLVPIDDPTLPFQVRRLYVNGRISQTIRRSDFHVMEGLPIAWRYEFDDAHGNATEMRFFRVDVNPDLPPETFIGPADKEHSS